MINVGTFRNFYGLGLLIVAFIAWVEKETCVLTMMMAAAAAVSGQCIKFYRSICVVLGVI